MATNVQAKFRGLKELVILLSLAAACSGDCMDQYCCINTDDWSNGQWKQTCDDYAAVCEDGVARPGLEWILGSEFNYPENNCCVCGKGKTQERKYWATSLGEDCPLGNIVATKDNCKNAASQLAKQYVEVTYSSENHPAGCWIGGPPNNELVLFNQIIDPSLTSPDSQLRGICQKDESICTNIKVVTKMFSHEISWTFGACSSAQRYYYNTTTNVQCCQPAGNYELVCKDSMGDGWEGGYLEINGQEYCKEFNMGNEKKENATMANV